MKLYKAGNSICTQKVFITLDEKGLDYDTHNINLFNNEQFDPEYLKLNPKGVVPTLVDDDRIIVESTLICEYLDDICPEPSLVPDDAYGKARMRVWSKYVDEGIFEATREISFSAMFREKMKSMPDEKRRQRFKSAGDASRGARFKSTFEEGTESPYVFQAIANFEKMFKNLEQALDEAGGPWILGETYSLADINLMPYVARMEYLALLDVWIAGRPSSKAWWARAKERPSFRECVPGRLTEDDISSMAEYGAKIRDRVAERRREYLDGLQ